MRIITIIIGRNGRARTIIRITSTTSSIVLLQQQHISQLQQSVNDSNDDKDIDNDDDVRMAGRGGSSTHANKITVYYVFNTE